MAQVVIPDMTVAAQAGRTMPQPVNLLTLGQQALALRGAQLQNQGMQNQLTSFNAKVAGARDMQKGFNPLTGQYDPNAGLGAVAQDPNAALYMPEALAQRQTAVATQGQQLQQRMLKGKWLGDSYGAVLAQPNIAGNPTALRENLLSIIKSNPFDSAQEKANAIATITRTPDAQLLNVTKAAYSGAQASASGLQPKVQYLNAGGTQIPLEGNSMAGPVGQPVPGAGYVRNTLSPAQAAQPVTLPSPSGAQQVTTLGQFNAAANGGAQPSIVATGPTTQQQAANQVAGAAQGNQAASFVADSTNLAQTRAALQGMMVELPNANGGPLAEMFRNVGASLGELGIKGMDQSTAYDLLQKGQAQVVVSRVADGLGVPTDGKMAALSAQTPGTHMTGTAGAVAVGQIEGVLDYQFARAKAAQANGVTDNPASSSKFNLKWQAQFPNAAVFQFHYLPRAFQQKYWNSMSPGERKAFHDQYTAAAQEGFVPPDPFNKQ